MAIYDNPRSRSFTDFCPRLLKFNIFKLLFLKKNTKPFEAKFHMEPPWDVGMKMFSSVPGHVTMMVSRLVWRFYGIGTRVCSNGPGHKTKMAFMSIYDKTFKNLLLWNQEADDLETFGI